MKPLFLLACSMFFYFVAYCQMPFVNADGGVGFEKNNIKFTLSPYGRNIVKVTMQPVGYKTSEAISDAVIAKPVNQPAKITSAANADFAINIGAMRFIAKGDTFFFGNKNNAWLAQTLASGDYKGFRFLLSPGEKIFGAGERALPLNRRGYKLNLYNSPAYGYGVGQENLNYSVPFITSSNNYALFFDNPSKGYLDIGKSDDNLLDYGAYGNQLNFYMIQGSSYEEILAGYHSLTGTQPLPPRYALGNFMSRFGYVNEKQLMAIKAQMKAANIPVDAIIIDLFWFGDSVKKTMGNLAWVNKKAWPDPAKMIGNLKTEGIKTILITEPFIVDSTLNYKMSRKYNAVDSAGKPFLIDNFYFGKAGLIDMFRNDSKDWFWSKYKLQMMKGVESWWGDLGEPETHPAAMYHNLEDLGYSRLFKADEVHNLYGHYWTKMLYNKYAAEYPAKRLFSLNRSGFAGTQRYAIMPWTGDVGRNWSGLQAQLSVLPGMSMSGVPYVHSDAGGFAMGEDDNELYIRWLEFAQYTPVFRPHGTEISTVEAQTQNYPSEPALKPEPYLSIAKKIVDNRYKLMPHNYTLAYQQALAGKPLISPLYYYFSADSNSYRAEDEYMWGSDMLIAPVIQKGAASRTLYLPQGNWYNYTTLAAKQGQQWITDSADLEATPVYIREGSFIATNNTWIPNTEKYSTADITVTYFPAKKFSTYDLYDDDGKTNKSIEKKLFELITFESAGWGSDNKITVRSNGGIFAGKPKHRMITLCIANVENAPATVLINGRKAEAATWDQAQKLYSVKLLFKGDTMEINFK